MRHGPRCDPREGAHDELCVPFKRQRGDRKVYQAGELAEQVGGLLETAVSVGRGDSRSGADGQVSRPKTRAGEGSG